MLWMSASQPESFAARISVFVLLMPAIKHAIGKITVMRMDQISAHMHLHRNSDSLFLKVVKMTDGVKYIKLHSKLGIEGKEDSCLFPGSDFCFISLNLSKSLNKLKP